MESHTPTPHQQPPGLEACPRCEHGRIGSARLTCTLCFGAGMVQPWVADQERTQQASWERYLSERHGGAPGAHVDLGECARCWPARCPRCPWSPPPFGPEQGLDLAA